MSETKLYIVTVGVQVPVDFDTIPFEFVQRKSLEQVALDALTEHIKSTLAMAAWLPKEK